MVMDMTVRISRIYGMDIFSDAGKYLGSAQDFIVDTEKGEIARVLLDPFSSLSKEDARKVLTERSIMYKNVKSVHDVVVVTRESLQSP